MSPEDLDAMYWSFQYFYHIDRANACMHNAPVKFSPITFRVAEALSANWPENVDQTPDLEQVLFAIGQYEEDTGR